MREAGAVSTTTEPATLRHWIGGAADERPAGRHGEVTDSATGEVVARVPFAAAADVDRAVRAATAAAPGWAATSLSRRADVLFRLRGLLDGARDELAEVIT